MGLGEKGAAMVRYEKSDVEELRNEVIVLRDEALKQDDFEWAVKLSHVIAAMAQHVETFKEVEDVQLG